MQKAARQKKMIIGIVLLIILIVVICVIATKTGKAVKGAVELVSGDDDDSVMPMTEPVSSDKIPNPDPNSMNSEPDSSIPSLK